MSQPVVVVRPPVVAVQPVAPVVSVDVGVPDSYVWDGSEYVGMVGDQYYYLGPNHVWLTLDAPRLARFHGWERGHGDWRTHAIRNDKYRQDAHGHNVPFHDVHAAPAMHPAPGNNNDHGHDAGHHDH
jgi:hypothetical protein